MGIERSKDTINPKGIWHKPKAYTLQFY